MKLQAAVLFMFVVIVASLGLLSGWYGRGGAIGLHVKLLILGCMVFLPTFIEYQRWKKGGKGSRNAFFVLCSFLFSFLFCWMTAGFFGTKSAAFAREYYWKVNQDEMVQTALAELAEDKGTAYPLPVTSKRFKRSAFALTNPETGTRFVFFVHGWTGRRDEGRILQCDQDPEAEAFLKSHVWRLRPLSGKWFSYSCFHYDKHPEIQAL